MLQIMLNMNNVYGPSKQVLRKKNKCFYLALKLLNYEYKEYQTMNARNIESMHNYLFFATALPCYKIDLFKHPDS